MLRSIASSRSHYYRICLFGLAVGCTWVDAKVPVTESLELDPFEDDDCLEAPHADTLLQLLNEMCDLLDDVLLHQTGWNEFDKWSAAHVVAMTQISQSLLVRPYCEPLKVSWMASECVLLLRSGRDGANDALECAAALDEDIYAQMTPPVRGYNTRLHLVLRSPWPAFRLLDLLVRLHPETGSTHMGPCMRYRDGHGNADFLDWPLYKSRLTSVVDAISREPDMFDLRLDDGPLSRQYLGRWQRIYGTDGMREVMTLSLEVADTYKPRDAYQAGCHLGVMSAHMLELLLSHVRDVDGYMHRLTLVVAQLINFLAPIGQAVRSDWPFFRLLYFANLLQRRHPRTPVKALSESGAPMLEPRAAPDATQLLCSDVDRIALLWLQNLGKTASLPASRCSPFAFVTASWGALSPHAGAVLQHWKFKFASDRVRDTSCTPLLLFLAADAEAMRQCAAIGTPIVCIDVPQRLGVEPLIAKYLSLASIARLGAKAVWLDLDVYVVEDPTSELSIAFDASDQPDIIFAKHLMSESLSPAMVAAKGSANAVDVLVKYARWLRENPFLLDHRGWDQFLAHQNGDHAGGFDYKGRKVQSDDGPNLSFVPKGSFAPSDLRYGILSDDKFGSGDGWVSSLEGSSILLFHFWGARESQINLFQHFYSAAKASAEKRADGSSDEASRIIAEYKRQPSAAPKLRSVLAGGKPLYLVAVSYASGCCKQSLKKNRRQALAVGVDDARAYGRDDLAPTWAAKNADILSDKKGGGWWLWKPHLILRTLLDPAVPWGRGVIVYVDAGNYLHADPRALATSALQDSDVAALRLKACPEYDWTSEATLEQLNVSGRYALVDQPQLGAYLLFFRKTNVAINFVKEWLRFAEDPLALRGYPVKQVSPPGTRSTLESNLNELPGFQKHQADQSIFSLLFKAHGFRSMPLEEGHTVVTLARWRE
eukprot:TRINITY_DN448_c1_g1_i2.p1 TRINITY_DN448_c1_g1~~TRINITY_DN448_c1_g1_i2.p1  ORF type:complete len:936 (-),score=75.32 TRINITY_DN448_c1_g1_i2:198-3005(-)